MDTKSVAGEQTGAIDPEHNYKKTAEQIGYVARGAATPETYSAIGFMCGLEIHQQLLTKSKLFCRCPAGSYHDFDDFNAEVIRHMRPTLSEMGEYDGTALMEKKTRKNITYRINKQTACTYEIDDTPPFRIDDEALDIAIGIALQLKTNVVGELHITRKQYLDGSIPTGFQRTAIVGIEGVIPLKSKNVRIIQISIEEDSCREVSDIGHNRVYVTDRLGMPLIESVTYPDMLTPEEAAEAAQYLRFLVRSTGKVRTGMGAARQDVNVSITGGTRIEIKGVSHIRWIPDLTHNEMFRQKALLEIARELNKRVEESSAWTLTHEEIRLDELAGEPQAWDRVRTGDEKLIAVNLPQFAGMLSFFTQPGQVFADEIAGRLKVIACLEHPNLYHSEQIDGGVSGPDWSIVREKLNAAPKDAQILFWGPPDDIATALETIEERCRMAFEGVPNETRKSLPDGTTIFERVLPGPDRMYPDTDSAPIAIPAERIERQRAILPPDVAEQWGKLRAWQVPEDAHEFLLARNLVPEMARVIEEFEQEPKFVGKIFGHLLNHLYGAQGSAGRLKDGRIADLFAFVAEKKLDREIVKELLPVVYSTPDMAFDLALKRISYQAASPDQIRSRIADLNSQFTRNRRATEPEARIRWIMGKVRPVALGNMAMKDLNEAVREEVLA